MESGKWKVAPHELTCLGLGSIEEGMTIKRNTRQARRTGWIPPQPNAEANVESPLRSAFSTFFSSILDVGRQCKGEQGACLETDL